MTGPVTSDGCPVEVYRRLPAMDQPELVSERDAIIRLLTPPFVTSSHDPGYIKGYVAGVRENGGQYTHGACWLVQAVAELGRHDRAATLLEMLMPVSHALTSEAADLYKLEPYVVAADIYGEPPHEGRGGWSWYTGSAGWLYRVALESILGFRVENGDTFVLSRAVVQFCLGEFSLGGNELGHAGAARMVALLHQFDNSSESDESFLLQF